LIKCGIYIEGYKERDIKLIIMKKLIVVLIVPFLISSVYAQKDTTAKLSREEMRRIKKEQKMLELEKQFNATAAILESKQYVLEADFLNDRRGNMINVLSNLNFVMVDTTYCAVQIGKASGMGANGVGGVTAEGKIIKYNFSKDEKNKTFSLQMSIITNIGIYDIDMDVSA
jgi:hypothetical protein